MTGAFRASNILKAAFAVLLIAVTGLLPTSAQEREPAGIWFEVEGVNIGLGQAPDGIDRSTPRDALASFVDAAEAADWEAAAHVLDLSAMPVGTQAFRGPERARQLGEVLLRATWLNWHSYPQRPDGMDETGTQNDPFVGQPRRSMEITALEVGGRPVSFRLDRVKAPLGEAVWLVSSQTVRHAPALFAALGPGRLEQQLPEWWQKRSLAFPGLHRWELLALPALLAGVALAALIVRTLMGWGARALTGSEIASRALTAARTPLCLVLAAGLARYVQNDLVSFSGPVTSFLDPALLILMVIGLTMALLRALDAVLDAVTYRFVGRIDDSEGKDKRQLYTSVYAFRRLIVLVAFVAAVGLALNELDVFASFGVTLLASAGIFTVVLGIAGQTVLGNILASLQLAIAKPIRIGDSIMYEGRWCYVESIFYTFVRLRTWDHRRLIVPVKHFVSSPFENLSMVDAKMTRLFSMKLDHMADIEAIRARFREICKGRDDVVGAETLLPEEEREQTDGNEAAKAAPKVLILNQDAEGVEVTFYATAPDPSTSWMQQADLLEEMLTWIRQEHPEWWPRERVVSKKGDAAFADAAE
ncbi:MAG: mechanosensitive ion channel domain-containing protein [Pseudomonadota bacterium]